MGKFSTLRVPHQTPMYTVAPDGRMVMSRTWVIFFERLGGWTGQVNGAGGGGEPGTPEDLPHAILGEVTLTTEYAPDQSNQLLVNVTIAVSFPDNDAKDVTRFFVHLLAPDTAVDTQEALVGGPGQGGTGGTAGEEVPGIVIGDDVNASKIVDLKSAEVMIEKAWDPERPFVQFQHPAPVEIETWRAIVVSAGALSENPADDSPSVTFTVDPSMPGTGGPDVKGREYCPTALNFHLRDRDGNITDLPYYDTAEGASPTWGFSATWENDEKDPRWPNLGGYDLDIVYPEGHVETHASKSSNDLSHDSPMWPIGAPGRFSVRLVSWSTQLHNPRNSYVEGLTPEISFDVAVPVGPSGSEYAQNVTGLNLVNPRYGKNAAGQKALLLPFVWQKPVGDRAYTGCILVMIREEDGVFTHYPLTGLESDDNQIVELNEYPTEPEEVTVYAKSVSNARINEYVPGYPGDPTATPAITFTINPPPETTPLVEAVQATVFYAKDEFGNNVYGYSGSWANPNKNFYPEYQGCRVYWAKRTTESNITEQKELTGIEPGTSFKTSAWPLVPDSGVYLYFVSFDVNGKPRGGYVVDGDEEKVNLAASPSIGPLFVTAQGGTISNDALPDLDVADFADGIEPITFVYSEENNANPAEGYITLPKSTTHVFNTWDNKLYRWWPSLSKYKQIGGGADTEFNGIIVGKVAAGAIRTRELAANEILVGPTPDSAGGDGIASTDRPPIFKVNDSGGTMVGFFGTYSGWQGIYGLNLKVGPSFADPTLEASSTGLTLRGTKAAGRNVTFELIGGGIARPNDYIRMSPFEFDPTYGSLVVKVGSPVDNTEALLASRGLAIFGGGRMLAAIARNPGMVWTTSAAGEIALYAPYADSPSGDPPSYPVRVLLTAIGKTNVSTGAPEALGVVRADRFDAGTAPGYTSPGDTYQAANTIWVRGGIVVGVT